MGLFKSREEKKIERDIEVRKGLNALKRNIRSLQKDEKSFIDKAKRARKIDDRDQYGFLKQMLKKTYTQRRMRERQLLSIETALQIKNQAESDADFAKAMGSVAQSISEVYGQVDYAKTQKNFEKAMMQAETLQQQMEVFLDMTHEHIMTGNMEGEDEVVSDGDIARMLDEEVEREEGTGDVDREIEQGLKDIESELGGGK